MTTASNLMRLYEPATYASRCNRIIRLINCFCFCFIHSFAHLFLFHSTTKINSVVLNKQCRTSKHRIDNKFHLCRYGTAKGHSTEWRTFPYDSLQNYAESSGIFRFHTFYDYYHMNMPKSADQSAAHVRHFDYSYTRLYIEANEWNCERYMSHFNHGMTDVLSPFRSTHSYYSYV